MSAQTSSSWAVIARRIICVMMLMCVGVTTFEQMNIDECDETVAHASLGNLNGVVDPPDMAVNTSSGQSRDNKQDISHPGSHICHCAHGHVGVVIGRRMSTDPFHGNKSAFDDPNATIPSVSLEPPQRPPLAA